MKQRVQINAPQVAAEAMADEVMVVNIERGTYYSLRETAAEVWGLIEEDRSVDEIMASLARRYEASPSQIEKALASFLAELEAEKIIALKPVNGSIAVNGNGSGNGASSGQRTKTDPVSAAAFTPPMLEKYTDMQELLQVDPIHDVDDEQGWPKMSAK